jgi:hypothetical protein
MKITSKEVVTRDADVPPATTVSLRTGQALIDVCAEIRGVLTDEEIDVMFARNRSLSRPVDL